MLRIRENNGYLAVNSAAEKGFYLIDLTVKFINRWCFNLRESAMIARARSSGSALVVALAVWFGGSGLAAAACYTPTQQLPAQTVNDFLGNSSQLLQDPKNADGGADMIALIRDLIASNPATLPVVIALLANANPAQQTAIGTGLGQAAGLCIRSDPAFAADIQTQLAGSTSDTAKNAYAAVTGNQPIRSVAGGGGVSGGSSGGSTGGSLGSTVAGTGFTQLSSTGTVNTASNFFQAGTTAASAASTSTTTTITSAATSVSP